MPPLSQPYHTGRTYLTPTVTNDSQYYCMECLIFKTQTHTWKNNIQAFHLLLVYDMSVVFPNTKIFFFNSSKCSFLTEGFFPMGFYELISQIYFLANYWYFHLWWVNDMKMRSLWNTIMHEHSFTQNMNTDQVSRAQPW